ncbi:MAG: hypothetical protein J6R64_05420 [Lentisphaeria bacterium]|nr:hypothetical protein [Lentisphaeria bacterium]
MNDGDIQQTNTGKKLIGLKRHIFLLSLLLFIICAIYISSCDRIDCEGAYINKWGSTILHLRNSGNTDWKNVEIIFESFSDGRRLSTTRKLKYWNHNELRIFEFGDSEFLRSANKCTITVYYSDSNNKKIVKKEMEDFGSRRTYYENAWSDNFEEFLEGMTAVFQALERINSPCSE